jgi:hypothetical protein
LHSPELGSYCWMELMAHHQIRQLSSLVKKLTNQRSK